VTLVASTSTTIARRGSVTVLGSFTDPDAGPWTYTYNWGNGTTSGTAAAAGSITATRSYAAAGRYKVTLTVTDSRGAAGQSIPLNVRVR
jgi:PKD repeat protein